MLREMDFVLIEDDEKLRESLALFFRARGCRVRAFGSADGARDSVEANPPDVVICDHWLPGTDGLTFLEWLGGRFPETGRILMTGHPDSRLFNEVKKAGLDEFILKPFTVDELETSIRRLIADRARRVAGGSQAL